MTMKTFLLDEIRNAVLFTVIAGGLLCLFAWMHQALGNWLLVGFSGIMVAFTLLMGFLSPVFMRITNKLVPLEEGELRNRLTALLEENKCTVRDIYVMDGSKRSTKANAYFGGFGKMKTIILFDTLLEQMTEDEILAVFAHEMGHNLHKDTLKSRPLAILQLISWVFIIWGLAAVPEICMDFGFDGVNYAFAFMLMISVVWGLVGPVFMLLISFTSKKGEYAADKFAADNGYGEALISGLKKLAKNNFACLTPHPVVVALTHSHPTISQRVEALEKCMKNK